MGTLRDSYERQKKRMAPLKQPERDRPMFAPHEIIEKPDGRYYKREGKEIRVWDLAGCIKTVNRRMAEGEGWADRFWAETTVWMTTYTGGIHTEKIAKADPMMSAWAIECYDQLCLAYDKLTATDAIFGNHDSATKRSECTAGLFRDPEPDTSTDHECFGELEIFGEPSGVESFGDTEESFGAATEEPEAFGE